MFKVFKIRVSGRREGWGRVSNGRTRLIWTLLIGNDDEGKNKNYMPESMQQNVYLNSITQPISKAWPMDHRN